MMGYIPYGRQDVDDDDVAAVETVLRSDWLTQGPATERLEQVVADYCGAEHAVAVSNGTAALHAACHAAGLGPGGLLWTSPITFVASANCARYVGADVGFVDIDPRSLNMDAVALEAKLEEAERADRLPDIVVPVHFGGASCNMKRIAELSRRFGFTVIEDASHAIGGRYKSHPVGSCEYSSMATFSFHPVKIVTTGEGGMIVTNEADYAERLRLFRSHGITRDPELMEDTSLGAWRYEQLDLGYNYRITDIQAALGVSQMHRIDEFVDRRNELAKRYMRLLEDVPVCWQTVAEDIYSAYHLFVVELQRDERSRVFAGMRDAGVGVNVHYIPVHLQPYYRRLGFRKGDFPVAEDYYSRAMTLPLYPKMEDEALEVVVDALLGMIGFK